MWSCQSDRGTVSLMPRRRPVDTPPPAFPDRWQGGSDDFGIVGTFNGHLSQARYRTDTWDDEEFEDRRNACEAEGDPY
jgi:hypothetical protein